MYIYTCNNICVYVKNVYVLGKGVDRVTAPYYLTSYLVGVPPSPPLLVLILVLCDEVVATAGVTLCRTGLGRLDELTCRDRERGGGMN